jgi:two-component system NtrC family sensor kinase
MLKGGDVRLPRVLVVDDIPANSKLVCAVLEPLACEVVVASSGREALERLDGEPLAVLLLDVQMPGMDGFELARRAREHPRGKDVPIIFLTAMTPDRDVAARSYGSGAVDLLFKPVDATILCSKVQVFLELHASQRRLAEAYEDLKAAQSQLVQAAKMASLGELIAGIAHEINNPLAFVISHLETVRKSLRKVGDSTDGRAATAQNPDWERANERLREMGLGLTRMRDLVTRLRIFSRVDEAERKEVSMRESVESVLTILGHRLKSRIDVVLRLEAPDLLECYPGPLNQALLNVVANAIEAIDGEGTVSIRTRTAAGSYHVAIQDTGSGIPAKLMDRVLEPFFTTKEPGEGTGLGLSITYSIMRKHGGSLALECPPAGGTVVTLSFPYPAGV